MPDARLVLDLPMPPSTNQIWRARRNARGGKPAFYLDPKYKAWKLQCDGVFLFDSATWKQNADWRGLLLNVPVRVEITLDRDRMRGDADNRIKPVQDWLQRAGIVKNDSQVKDVRAHWGTAPKGCRVVVEAL